MMIKKLTPIVNVAVIEPMLAFWQALGFEVTMQVPHDDVMGFAILARDGVEVMYQSKASVAADVPALVEAGTSSIFFIEVDDVVAAAEAVSGHDVVVPMRDTFYGSREVFVRAPCGTIVGLAEFKTAD